jgi:hypothetical protein
MGDGVSTDGGSITDREAVWLETCLKDDTDGLLLRGGVE